MIKHLFASSRPKTLMVGIAPVFLGNAIAFGVDGKNFSPLVMSITLLCTVLMQIGTNLVNEFFDFIKGVDDSSRIGPKRSLLTGQLTPSQIKRSYQLCFILSFLIGLFLIYIGGLKILLLGLISLLAAYCYTGGPYPLSHYYLGEVTAFVFFGPVAVIGSYYLQTKGISETVIILSLIPGFISAGLMSLNNLRDISSDSKTDKKTISIFLGEKKSRIFTVILGLCPLLVSIISSRHLLSSYNYLIYIPPFLFLPLWRKIIQEKDLFRLNEGIAAFGKYNVIYCLFISLTIFLNT